MLNADDKEVIRARVNLELKAVVQGAKQLAEQILKRTPEYTDTAEALYQIEKEALDGLRWGLLGYLDRLGQERVDAILKGVGLK